MRQLTEQQQAVLDAIVASIEDRGYPPSIRELAITLRYGSLSTVHGHLKSLERAGVIERPKGRSRSITINVPAHSTCPTCGAAGWAGK